MELKVAGITKKEFDETAKWVVKFIDRPRVVGTYPELEKMFGKNFESNDNVRDVDLLWDGGQPDSVKGFLEFMHECDKKYGWMTIP